MRKSPRKKARPARARDNASRVRPFALAPDPAPASATGAEAGAGTPGSEQPAPETALVGPHPTDRDRDALGRWRSNNTGAVEHDGYAERSTVAQLRAEDAARILADRGFDDAEHPPSTVYRRLVEKLAGGFLILDNIEAFIGTEPIERQGPSEAGDGVVPAGARPRRTPGQPDWHRPRPAPRA